MAENFIGKKILLLTAHPDDESYGAAGTIYKNNKAGGKAFLISATLGERGTAHLKQPLAPSQLKKTRKKELLSSSHFLNISKLFILNFPDGKVAFHKKALFEKSFSIAKKLKPDYILSFGKDGISGHNDHIAVGQIALMVAKKLKVPFVAFALPPKVKQFAFKWLKLRGKSGHHAKVTNFIKPNIRIAINSRIKKKAIMMHASQMDNKSAFSGFPRYAVKELLKAEYFYQVKDAE